MLKKLLLAGSVFLFLWPRENLIYAQSIQLKSSFKKGVVQSGLSMPSKTLGTKIKYTVYLPPAYFSCNDSFPVIYLLHGYGGDETSWTSRIGIQYVVDSLIDCGSIPQVVIVMPDGGNSYYINDYKDKFRYGDFLENEFIPDIEKLYKVSTLGSKRIIAGLSMGGYGAIIHCLKHPEEFGICIALSAAVRTDSQFVHLPDANYERNFSILFGEGLEGINRLTINWKENSAFHLLDQVDTAAVRKISWYFDCGLDDPLLTGNEELHQDFITLKIPHEFLVRAGGHNKEYWTSGLDDWLRYIGKELKN